MVDTPTEVKVIGAGFGRTGTASLKLAFEKLGFGPAYHMKEVFGKSDHIAAWHNAATKGDTDFRKLLAGFQSTTDFPACCFYKELMQTYPDAKVVLTVRDFESWYQSASQTIYPVRTANWGIANLFLGNKFRQMVEATVWNKIFFGRFDDKEHTQRVWDDYIAEVRRFVPPERLLVFHVKEGWEPLCQFLEVPVPQEPFPRVNDTQDFKAKLQTYRRLCWAINMAAVVVPVGAVLAYAHYKSRN